MKNSQKAKQIDQVILQKPNPTLSQLEYRRTCSLGKDNQYTDITSPLTRNRSNSFLDKHHNRFSHRSIYPKRHKQFTRSTSETEKTIYDAMISKGILKPFIRKRSSSILSEEEISPSIIPHIGSTNLLQMLPEEEHQQYDRCSEIVNYHEQKFQQQTLAEDNQSIRQDIVPSIAQIILHIHQIHQRQIAFYQIVNKEVGSFFTILTEMMSRIANARRMTQQQLKCQFCWNTVSFMVDICEAQDLSGIVSTAKDRNKMIQRIDSQIKKILEFIEFKYLPVREMGTSESEFILKLRDMEQGNVDSSDILGGSGLNHQFTMGKEDYSTDVKLFLNALICETKKISPVFMKQLQQVFYTAIEQEQTRDTAAQIDFITMIDESIEEYTVADFKTMDLHMKNAKLLRVCVAWAMEMYQTMFKAEEYINSIPNFKSTIRGQYITLTKKRRETLIGHLKQVANRVFKIREERWQVLNNLIIDLLLHTLSGFKGHDGLDRKDVMIAKLSQFIYQSMDSNILITLNMLIKELNSIRTQYDHQVLESNIDLITFTQSDILKCRITGSRNSLYQIYKKLLNCKDALTILSMKNRLETPSQDIILNVKLRDSFIVCQIQLVLQSSPGHSYIMSSLLRNIQQWRLPIIYECCIILVQLDQCVSHFDSKHPVVFNGQNMDFSLFEFRQNVLYCHNKHQLTEMVHSSNKLTFLCRACSVFYKSMSFGVKWLNCQECLVTLCPKCVLSKWQGYQQVMTSMYANTGFLNEFCHMPTNSYGFWGNNKLMRQALNVADAGEYLLLLQYDYQSLKMRIVKQYEGQLIDAFLNFRQLPKQIAHDSENNWCSIIKFKLVEIVSLSSLTFYKKMQINVPWYDFEPLLKQTHSKQVVACRSQKKLALIIDIPLEPPKINRILQCINLEKSVERELGKEEINLQLSSRNLHDLSILNLVKNRSALFSINLWQNKLTTIQPLAAFHNIQELYLRQNGIEDITPLLQLSHLQHLNLQRNKLNGKFPRINFPEMETLDISCNELNDVSNLSNSCISSMQILRIGVNLLDELPIIDCPHLHTYYFSINRISSLENLCKSNLPKARIIHGCKNSLSGALPRLNFPYLNELWLVDNFVENIDSLAGTHMQHFQNMKICGNYISGKLPILDMPSLISVQLEDNDITSIESLTHWNTPILKCLYLASNRISGQLPFMNFKDLNILDLNHNKLKNIDRLASMPIKAIQQIKLSSNLICGALPIFKFSKLKRLDLQVNRIDDVLSLSKCILPELQYLDISQNHIRTSVPIMQFDMLVEIRLFYNAIKSLLFLRESHLLPKLEAIIIHPSQLVMLPQQEAKLRTYRFRDEQLSKKVEVERRQTCLRISCNP